MALETTERNNAPTGGKANDAAAALLRESFLFMGRAYAFVRGVARNEEVGLYTVDSGVKELIDRIRGATGQKGKIEGLEELRDRIDEYVDKFSKLNVEDLDRMSKGGYTSSDPQDGGVTSTPPELEDPTKVFG